MLTTPGTVEIADIEVPETLENDGLLKIDATGVCGSDAAAYQGKLDWPLPCALGHEVIGTIERLGAQAAERWGLDVGQRVAVEEYLPCGTCPACTDGYHQTCAWSSRYGASRVDRWPGLWGGFGDYLYLHPQALLHPVPEGCSAELAQLFIPVANGLYWVQETGGCRAGDDVLIIGPGPHGLGCVVGAKESGARSITILGLDGDERRLSVGAGLGATTTLALNGSPADVLDTVREATSGQMPGTVINTANSPQALDLAVMLAAERGTVVQVGVTDGFSTAFPVREVWRKALTIRGVRGRPSRMIRSALEVIASGRYPLQSLCTHRFSIEQSENALKSLSAGSEGIVRAIICPDDDVTLKET